MTRPSGPGSDSEPVCVGPEFRPGPVPNLFLNTNSSKLDLLLQVKNKLLQLEGRKH